MARSSVEGSVHYCAFDAEQQALVEDGAGAQHESESTTLDAAGRGAMSLPYTVLSPKVWNVSHEMPARRDILHRPSTEFLRRRSTDI
jgi:hypothetical protein